MAAKRVLVVEADTLSRWSLSERLRAEGHEVLEAGTAADAIDHADQGVELVLLDHQLPDDSGLGVLRKLRDMDADTVVMMLAPAGARGVVVEAMDAGAYDYATTPLDLDDVALRVTRALEATRMRRALRTLRESLSRPYSLSSILGESEPMQRIRELVRRVASSPGSTVLITGEGGTDKDLVASVIHYTSGRAARPFLGVACAALTEAELEIELFGQELAASGDVPQHTRGALEQADEGTVFLAEIGAMSANLQAKLLRFLEEKSFRRADGTADLHADVRVVATSSLNLEERVRAGAFREDLYYRLNVLRIEVPPLRARGYDVILLARHFAEVFAREIRRPAPQLTPAAAEFLTSYAWPGNVRELRNLVQRAVLIAQGAALQPSHFGTLSAGSPDAADGSVRFVLPEEGVNLEEVERSLVEQALERSHGNQTRAAALLGLHRDQIRYRIEKFGLVKKDA
jgi:two-component system response regulator AtoC